MKLKSLIIVLAASLSVGQAWSQQSLSLEDYRQRVIDYSKSLKISKEELAAAIAQLELAKTGFLPNLSGEASANMQTNDPSGFGLKLFSYNAKMGVQQVVYGGGAISNKYQAAKIQRGIAEMGEQLTMDQVAYGADMAYWTASTYLAMYRTQQEFYYIVKNLYDVVNERYTDGYVSKTDLLMVETRLKEAEVQVITANKNYTIALQNLNILIGNTDVNTVYLIADTIRMTIPEPVIMGLDQALERRPDYQIAQKQVELGERNVKLSRSAFNPKFVIGFQGVWGTPMINFTGISGTYGVAYGSLQIPIFHFGERRKTVAASTAALRASQYRMEGAADQVNIELNNAITSINECRKQVIAAESNLQLSNDNLELNTFSYNEGRLPILDVLSAQITWHQSYLNVINANYLYKVAVADYNKALGGLIK